MKANSLQAKMKVDVEDYLPWFWAGYDSTVIDLRRVLSASYLNGHYIVFMDNGTDVAIDDSSARHDFVQAVKAYQEARIVLGL